MNSFSIIIPTLNECSFFTKQQRVLTTLLKEGHEIIVVDGGSDDGTLGLAEKIGCKCISTKASRGHQQHVGANTSSHHTLIFLHADTQLPSNAINDIRTSLDSSNSNWGRFNVEFTSNRCIFKVIAWFMNKRSCITGIVTGDHTLFVNRQLYFKCGGFSDTGIMEDIDLSKRLKKYSRPICINNNVITSSRKWEHQGVIKTILIMWSLRLQYYFGASEESLIKQYYS